MLFSYILLYICFRIFFKIMQVVIRVCLVEDDDEIR
ncbi:MAG: hypothetical protein RLZZ546_2444, partial [Bacteroidota bacterium]